MSTVGRSWRWVYVVVYGGGALVGAVSGVAVWVITGNAALGMFFLLLASASVGCYFLATQPSRLRRRRAEQAASALEAQTPWQPAQAASPTTAPGSGSALTGSTPSGLIVVRRPRGYAYAVLRRVRVTVDGRDVGGVKPGEQLPIPVAPGRHVVRARMDWTGSPDTAVDVARGQQVLLEVEPAGDMLTGAFSREKALTLTQRA